MQPKPPAIYYNQKPTTADVPRGAWSVATASGDIDEWTGAAWIPKFKAGTRLMVNLAIEPGHNKNFDRVFSCQKMNPGAALSASGSIKATPGIWGGCKIQVATATAVILIKSGGASGTVIDVIAIGLAAGTDAQLKSPVTAASDIYADFQTGTGTIIPYFL